MLRWVLVVWLAVASAVAAAQPAPTTDRAVAAVQTAEQRVRVLDQQRAQLNARYQGELTAIDHLKKEKPSWRRDRELNDSLASSNDTASQLAALDRQRAQAQDAAAAARKTAVAAIDAELGAGATPARAQQLSSLRARLAPPTRAPSAIHIPSTEVDPAADAGELEQQAAQIRATEHALEAQAQGLDQQAKDLDEVAAVRKQHQRANDLAMRDDDAPQRVTQHTSTTTGGADTTSNPGALGGGAGSGSGAGQNPSPTGGGGTGTGTGAPPDTFGGNGDHRAPGSDTFEAEATVVLGDVIDRSTIEGLARASRSGDPSQRAEAARRARDAVRAKLDQLRRQRALIEQRARALKQ